MSNVDITELPYASFYSTKTAQITTTVTGSTSALSSFLIILFIIRSEGKLSSPYHRIMFFMSFWDIVLSIAMALTIIPLPADDDERFYPFDGKSYGSIVTCEIQGFLYLACSCLCIASNSTLCIFYVCTIRCGMKEETVKKKLVPSLLILFTVASVSFPGFMLSRSLFNPTPFDTFCSYSTVPYNCDHNAIEDSGESEDRDDDLNNHQIACIRGDPMALKLSFFCGIVYMGTQFITVLVCMALIVSKFYRDDITMKKGNGQNVGSDTNGDGNGNESVRNSDDDGEGINTPDTPPASARLGQDLNATARLTETQLEMDRMRINNLKLRKTMLMQAIMYIGAFLLTWAFTMALYFVDSSKLHTFNEIKFLRVVFEPLQGFFNALIFFYHKAYNFRRANDCAGWGEAVKAVFLSPSQVPEILVSEVVTVHIDSIGNQRRHMMAAMQQSSVPTTRDNASAGSVAVATPAHNEGEKDRSFVRYGNDGNSRWSLAGGSGLSLSAPPSHFLSLGMISMDPSNEEGWVSE